MMTPDQARLMARYNAWQNRSIYTAASSLDDAARRQERGAFFGSIHNTLSHILWADRIWMSRLAGTPLPQQGSIPDSVKEGGEWALMAAARSEFDAVIEAWTQGLGPDDLAGDLTWYSGAVGAELTRPRWVCAAQLFNHQTHHRGQVHTLLTQAGARPEDTDIPFRPGMAW